MVYENIYHPFPQQGWFVQTKAGQITSLQLFPRLLGWKWCESRCKVPALEIQSGQQGTSQSISSVSLDSSNFSRSSLTDFFTVSPKQPIPQIFVWFSQPWKKQFYKMHWRIQESYKTRRSNLLVIRSLPTHTHTTHYDDPSTFLTSTCTAHNLLLPPSDTYAVTNTIAQNRRAYYEFDFQHRRCGVRPLATWGAPEATPARGWRWPCVVYKIDLVFFFPFFSLSYCFSWTEWWWFPLQKLRWFRPWRIVALSEKHSKNAIEAGIKKSDGLTWEFTCAAYHLSFSLWDWAEGKDHMY